MLIYGSEIWVAKDAMMTALEGFDHRIARWIVGVTANKGDGGEWEWASVDVALETMDIWLIRE